LLRITQTPLKSSNTNLACVKKLKKIKRLRPKTIKKEVERFFLSF